MSVKEENIIEEFIQEACLYLRERKKNPSFYPEDFFKRLIEIVNKSQKLQKNIALEDIEFKLNHVCTFMNNRFLQNITEKEFIEYLKSDILVTKEYTFCFPIYNAFKFPNKMKMGFATTAVFEDINSIFQEAFSRQWKDQYPINSEYFNTEQKFLEEKKRCLFLELVVEANGHTKASEKALILINESVNILRFLHRDDVPVEDFRYIHKKSKVAGGEISYRRPSQSWINYRRGLGIGVLTEIITKQTPTIIETKIRNTLNLFGIQTSIKNNPTRFLMLITCLESLLLSGGDKDYIGWKLAEKTAFLVGKDGRDRMNINEDIKQAYKKRSNFIHGETKKNMEITKADVEEIQIVIIHVLNKLINLRSEEFTQIKKDKKKPENKNVEEYIEKIKFGLS